MTRPKDVLPPNICDHCGGPVSVRKPSKTGKSFCTDKPSCQSAKQRFYRELRRQGDPDVNATRLRYLADVANLERSDCHACGLERAVPGWAHRDGQGGACFALGRQGAALGQSWIDAVHPERALGV